MTVETQVVAQPLPHCPHAISPFHRVWPPAALALAVIITAAWSSFLGYGLFQLVFQEQPNASHPKKVLALMLNPWIALSLKDFQVGIGAQNVVGLRLMCLASGGQDSRAEFGRMIVE